MLNLIFLLVAAIVSLICAFACPFNYPSQIWIPIIMIPLGFIAINFIFCLFLYITSLFFKGKKEYKKKNRFFRFIFDIALGWVLNWCNVKIKVTGMEKLPKDKPYLLVYNHTSSFDPLAISYIIRKKENIQISKPETFKIPFVGGYMNKNCYLAIDRNNDREALKTIIKASKFISENKYIVSIAPEGTRNKDDVTKLFPFKPGALKIAQKAKAPIVICELHDFNLIHKNSPFKRTTVYINVLDVIPEENVTTATTIEIANKAQEIIQSKIDSYKNNN